jgi:GNAT superfamily N-acetyltransferase
MFFYPGRKSMTNDFQIKIISDSLISIDVQKNIDELDRLAFAEDRDHDDPEFDSIDWSSHIEWMVLGRMDDKLVTLLGLLRREILVGVAPVWVVGVGGVATHPNWQKRGLSSALFQAAEKFMREKMNASFGLLVCAEECRSFYGRVGWKHVADELFFTQNGQRRSMKASVMILPLTGQAWLPGEIDLCGLPW